MSFGGAQRRTHKQAGSPCVAPSSPFQGHLASPLASPLHPQSEAIAVLIMDDPAARNHNQGPSLDDEGPPWGDGDPYLYVCWTNAWARAWKRVPVDIALFRMERAEALGLTYEEYTLEILERGRHLQASDTERIAEIKRKRDLP